jgi:hypothetical protein
MKRLRAESGIVFLIVFFSFFILNAQSANQNSNSLDGVIDNYELVIDSLKTKISNLETEIREGSYTRIPNTDFENIIDNKIQKSLRETLNWWLIVIAALVSALGFLINRYAKAYLQTIVDAKVNQLKNENEEQIKRISNQYFSSVIESLVDFKMETIQKKMFKVEEIIVEDLISYLNDEKITISEKKKVDLIDVIMRCYYYNNYPQRKEKMIKLIKEYGDDFNLLSTTYANAAIAFSSMYDIYGTKDYLDSAIENCNNSIRILPDYGLAFALKLELYTIAQVKALDDEEKLLYEKELQKVFREIENNSSTYLCTELISRFKEDENTFMKTYLDILYSGYPDDIARIRERADNTVTKTE